MPRFLHVLTLMLALVLAAAAHAAPSGDAALDERTAALSEQLRCLVCQNQTITDSQADLAVDLRRQVRELLIQGRSEQEVIRYMTERYGDFVVYRPPVRANTLPLWFAPVLILVAGAVLLVRRIRRMPAAAPLDAAARARAEQLLDRERGEP